MIFRKKGFTLIELLIVVAIIGIIAGIAVPAVLSALKRSKFTRTKADLKTIAVELNTYYSDHDRYPSSLRDASPERKDIWGEPFEYDPFDGSVFCVCSGGTNKVVDQNCDDISDENFVWKHGCDICRLQGIDKDAFWGNCAIVAPH
ncbi:Tfp pilus assembly protein PilE [Candidatus Moduliflexus flocculans]|uniref:Tfp pilus assembly protein PilE n=1 Tax=Candidatus Moduliflexus flocculans TaxID=1499966 RepID=A0A0S6VVD0_9BACT|nr:Tfp pilus assembly protein PilE [Candidatus Moduliflexus flocculans]